MANGNQGVDHMADMSIYTIWLVKDLNEFRTGLFSDSPRPTSGLDRLFSAGIQYNAWHSLLFSTLGDDLETYRDWAQRWRNGTTGELFFVSGFPMLSRLND